jgi:hypothetical protein
MNDKPHSNIIISHLFKRIKVYKKVFIFLLGFILFGTLSFISYKPLNNKIQIDNDIVLFVENIDEKDKNISDKTILNSKNRNTKFALIIGSYVNEYNAENLVLEMKKRGFKDCNVVISKNNIKYWVVLKCYDNKNQAILARERYLIDGWIKQL